MGEGEGLQQRGRAMEPPQRRRGRKKKRRRTQSLAFPIAITILLLGGGALIFASRATRPVVTPLPPPQGTQTFTVASAAHVEEPVDYEQDPPVGGPHWGQWQNCGFYSEPVRTEAAVHSLEHGAIWITYRPTLSDDEIDRLRRLTRQPKILVSPWQGLQANVVASAWGAQIELEGADDERLDQFIQAFRSGGQAPEPGAPCAGGIGEPE